MTQDEWEAITHFKPEEFFCKCNDCHDPENSRRYVTNAGYREMDFGFVQLLDQIREYSGIPMTITSGYRCPNHPIEKAKSAPGPHSTGKAADILAHGEHAQRIVELALHHADYGPGIGLMQHGDLSQRFVHLDYCEDAPGRPRPWIWTYK